MVEDSSSVAGSIFKTSFGQRIFVVLNRELYHLCYRQTYRSLFLGRFLSGK
jgi:hypothetical protein